MSAIIDREFNKFVDGNTTRPKVRVTLSDSLLLGVEWDYIEQAQTSTTDEWTYKNGGSGGTTVRVILITYTDSTKNTILSVYRSL